MKTHATDGSQKIAKRNFTTSLMVVSMAALWSGPVSAADYTWGGGDGNWNASNWLPGNVVGPTSSAHTAIINSGTVKLTGHDMFGNGGAATSTTAIQINNGATLDSNGMTNPIVGLTLNGGNLLINGGHSDTWGGVRLSGTLTAGGSAASTISSTGILTRAWIGVGNNTTKDLTISVADATGNANTDLTINSAMIDGNWGENPHGVTKIGAGTASLQGTNTYSGETKIQVGTLLLNGAHTGVGAFSVSGDAILGGNGSTTSAVTIQNTGRFVVDISDWTGTAGTGFTDLQIGSLNCAGTWVVDVKSSAAFANFSEVAKVFAFINVTGVSNFNPANVTVATNGFPGAGTWSVRQVANAVELVYAPSGDPRTTTTTELVSSLNPSLDDDSVEFTATVKADDITATGATGTIEFRVDGGLVATENVINGTASFTTNTFSPGSHAVTATYSGDDDYKPSVGSLTQTNQTPYMLTFTLGTFGAATIDGLNVTKTVPYGTTPSALSAVAATYTLTSGATCTPASGAAQDFNAPIVYVVKSADESITKEYTVTITVAPPPTYTWQGGTGNWNSPNWLLNDGSVSLVAGPTGSSNTRLAMIDSGQVNLQGNDIFGGGGTADSPYITINNATLASANTVNQFQRLTLNNGVYLCNGGANSQYPAAYFARTLTATGSSFVNLGTGNNNMINLGVGGTVGSAHYNLTIDTPSSTDSLTFNAVLQTFTGGQLIKTGSGTLMLNAANTYNGATNVNVGTLLLNGANTGGGGVTVASDARLGGNGSTTSGVTVESGGKLLASVSDWTTGTASHLTAASLALPATWSVDVVVTGFSETNKTIPFLTATGGISGFVAPTVNGPGAGTWEVRQNPSDATILELVYTAGGFSPYEIWAGTSGYDLSGGPDDDDDGDGMNNFQEFAFGLDPTSSASVNPITDISALTDGLFSYTRQAGSGLTYTFWTSDNLLEWDGPVAANEVEAGEPDENGVETMQVELISPPTGTSFFIKVRAQ